MSAVDRPMLRIMDDAMDLTKDGGMFRRGAQKP
jgi:hypothetical protein